MPRKITYVYCQTNYKNKLSQIRSKWDDGMKYVEIFDKNKWIFLAKEKNPILSTLVKNYYDTNYPERKGYKTL